VTSAILGLSIPHNINKIRRPKVNITVEVHNIIPTPIAGTMATTFVCRRALRRQLVPISLGLTSGAWMLSRQRPLRLDAAPQPPRTVPTQRDAAEKLDPNILRQISSGSLSGRPMHPGFMSSLARCLHGYLLTRLPGRTRRERLLSYLGDPNRSRYCRNSGIRLVPSAGAVRCICANSIQVAARSGIDLVRYFKLKEKVQSSRILSSLQENTTFKLCFGLTFAMSAFMRF